jgi:putative inorganic carbon (HCO3(-)) transporter
MFMQKMPTGQRPWLAARLVEAGFIVCGLLLFYWPHPPLGSLLVLLAMLALTWFRLEIAIALLPLAFPYDGVHDGIPFGASGFPSFILTEIGVFVCLAVAGLRHLLFTRERRETLQWIRSDWKRARFFFFPAALLAIGAALALLSAPDRHESLRAYREEMLEPLLYVALLLRYLQTRSDLIRTISAFLLSALVVSCTGIVQGVLKLNQYLIDTGDHALRVPGPYGSPNNLGFAIERALPLLLALAFIGLFRRHSADEPGRPSPWRDPLRWACYLAAIPLFWALYWTRSRGAEAAVLVVIVLLFLFEARRLIAILPVLALGAVGGFLFRSRLLQLFNEGHQGTVSERFIYWKAALLIIRDHFFLGTGPVSFRLLYNIRSPKRPRKGDNSYVLKALDGQSFPSSFDPSISHPHNIILDFWISSGLLGLAALFWLLGTFTTRIIRLYRLCVGMKHGALLQRLLLGIAGGMLTMVVHGMVDNSFFLPDLAFIFWFFIGVLLILDRLIAAEHALAQPPGKPERTMASSDQKATATSSDQEISAASSDQGQPSPASAPLP